MAVGGFERLDVGGEAARLYVASAGEAAPSVVIFHPWWGLNDDVTAYADRLAAAGFTVMAPDLVRGRIAATIEDAEALANGKDDAHADAVALATIDRLAAPPATKLGTIGFSMGAAWAVWSAAQRPAVAATVVYYGTMFGPSLAASKAPVLAHFAADDPYEPEESVAGFEKALRDAGRRVRLFRYANTGHWFAEPSRDAWREEVANLAFDQTVTFLHEYLRPREAS